MLAAIMFYKMKKLSITSAIEGLRSHQQIRIVNNNSIKRKKRIRISRRAAGKELLALITIFWIYKVKINPIFISWKEKA